MFKTRLDTFGNDLGIFAILKIYWFYENISKSRPSMEHWAKKIFWKNYPKTCSKHVWHFWERFWSFMEIWKFFDFLKTFRRWNTGQKKFIGKITPKHVQNTFGHFWGTFLVIFGILKNFRFLKTFRRLDPPWNTGQNNFFEKITPKLVQNMFGHFWERFREFCNFENLLIFWKHFEDSTIHGKLGQKNFRKNYPKTCSKHVWTILGTTLGFFAILKNFRFLKTFRRLDPPWNTGQKNFS